MDNKCIELVRKDEGARSPNSVLRGCLGMFDSVIVAGYSKPEHGDDTIIIYACEGITEEMMALISLKLQHISNIGWEKGKHLND